MNCPTCNKDFDWRAVRSAFCCYTCSRDKSLIIKGEHSVPLCSDEQPSQNRPVNCSTTTYFTDYLLSDVTERLPISRVKRETLHCEICGGTGTKRLAYDHCHSSGRHRGYLCTNCNIGLGNMQDDPRLLRDAADYLEASHYCCS